MDAVRYPGCGRRGLPLATACSRRRRRRLLDAVTLRTQRTVAVAERQRSDRRYLLVLVDLAGQRISTSGTRSRRRAAQSGPALACGVSQRTLTAQSTEHTVREHGVADAVEYRMRDGAQQLRDPDNVYDKRRRRMMSQNHRRR